MWPIAIIAEPPAVGSLSAIHANVGW